MFEKLKNKWQVNNKQLFLILWVFAITGTSTAYIYGAITTWVGLTPESPLMWRIMLKGAVLIFGYRLILLIVSVPFGQFAFFWQFEKKILRFFGKLIGLKNK